MSIQFFIPGIPKPGGSKKAFVLRRRDGSIVFRPSGAPMVNVTDDAKGNGEWKQNCKFFAGQNYDGAPLEGAVRLEITFVMPRLKGHFGSGRNAGVLKVNAPTHHTVKPDATKLTRSTEDALTGILWRDDAAIAEQEIRKVYGERPGAFIRVLPLSVTTMEAVEKQAVAAGERLF